MLSDKKIKLFEYLLKKKLRKQGDQDGPINVYWLIAKENFCLLNCAKHSGWHYILQEASLPSAKNHVLLILFIQSRMSEVCLTIFQVNRAAFWKSYGQKYTVRHPYWRALPSSCQHRKGCMKNSITHMSTSNGSTRLDWRAPRHQSLQQKQRVICWLEYMYKVVINSVSFSWSWAPWILKPGPFCVSQVPGPRTTCLQSSSRSI